MRERKRRLERSRLPSAKRRRLELKQERCLTKGATEVLEGATYQSGKHFLQLAQQRELH